MGVLVGAGAITPTLVSFAKNRSATAPFPFALPVTLSCVRRSLLYLCEWLQAATVAERDAWLESVQLVL